MLSSLILFVISTSTVNDAYSLKSWHTHTGMGKALANQIAGYDMLTDKIWIFGGHNDSWSSDGLSHTYFEFDTNSNQFTERHNESIISTSTSQSYVTINDTIYTYYKNHIQFFNMQTQIFTNNTDTYLNVTMSNPCMATDGKRYIMLIGGVDIRTSEIFDAFHIYDLFEQKYLTNGPSLNLKRANAACLVGSDHFIYVFGGIVDFPSNTVTDTVEKINITNIEDIYNGLSWEILESSKLTVSRSKMAVIEHNGYIYVIGGETDMLSAVVDVLNISSQNITAAASLPSAASNFAIAGNEKYIYLFGGSLTQNACISDWTVSNNLLNNENNYTTFWDLFWNWKGIAIICCIVMIFVVIIVCLMKRRYTFKQRHNARNLQNNQWLTGDEEESYLSSIIQK